MSAVSQAPLELAFRRELARDVVVFTRKLGRVLHARFGRRAWYIEREDWSPLGSMPELTLDERREVGVTLRIAGERAGGVSAREGSWFRARLLLRLADADAPACFRELIEAVRPEKAACGPNADNYVSLLTYREERPAGSPPDGVTVERWSQGWGFTCEDAAAIARLHAWLSGKPEPVISSEAPAAAQGVAVLVPSYLRHPLPEPNPDETVAGGLPAGPALPFRADAPVVAPPAIPIEPADDSGHTALAPLPPELGRARLVVPAPPDPDVTLPPIARNEPLLPFEGTTTPERIRAIAGPPAIAPAEDAGETVILPTADEMLGIREIVDAAQADLPLPEYAALRAALSVQGEDNAEVLRRFGLNALQKRAVQQKYFARFRDEPDLRERFEALLRQEMRKLNRGSGGNR